MKRILTAFVTFALLLSFAPAASAVSVSDFTDVKTTDWFYSAVSFVVDKGMFEGTSSATFTPGGTMERGMFVTVLGRYGNVTASVPTENAGIVTKSDVRLRSGPTTQSDTLNVLNRNTQVEILDTAAGTDDPSYKWYYVNYNGKRGYIREDLMEPMPAAFSDVPENAYYSSYVYWAYNTGVAGKTGDNTFSPTRAVTREEICSMMYNFAKNRNLEIKATVSVSSFSDYSSINSSYAEAVTAMQKAGVVDGYGDGTFRPKNSATRAEASAMLSRFVDCISYKPVSEASYDSAGNYIWGTEVPKSGQASASYFSDACFIGHSITVGMQNYLGLTDSDFYAFNGAATRTIQTYDSFTLPGGETGTLSDALKAKQYGKVYIMLGTNECSVGAGHQNTFYSNMSTIIDLVRGTQPNAKIYLFALTPVSQSCSESSATWSRDNIIRYNTVVKQLCRDKKAYYLNVFDLLADSDGFLPANACASDGIHILSSQYAKIKTYLLTHTM